MIDFKFSDEDDYEHTIAKKPIHLINIWKTLLFIYACLIQSLTISLSLLDSTTSNVQEIFMFLVYLYVSAIIMTMIIYLYINRNQTFEEANKEVYRAHKISFSLAGEKVGLYLRFGLILIGLLSLTYIGLVNARVKISSSECVNYGLIICSSSQTFFFVVQMVFILKYHSIIILRHGRLFQFGLFNIIIANILTWETSLLSKISYTGNLAISNPNCTIKSLESLHLYFLPSVAEYSVIGMAVLYEIQKRIGKCSLIETIPEVHSSGFNEQIKRSIPGLVIGGVSVIGCMSCTILIILSDVGLHESRAFYIHTYEELVLYTFTIIILIIAFSKIRKLRFSFSFLQNNIDKNLLQTSSFLSLVFSTLIAVYCFTFLADNLRLMRGITALLEIIQIVLQTAVIQDSFYRCIETPKQRHEKPAQNFLAILVGCNFGLWLLKSFQLKNGDIFFNKNQAVVQNNVLFQFFLNATLPLSVLYRYHSSCCFAGAFSKIYQEEADRFEGMLRHEGFDHCDLIRTKKLKYTSQYSKDQENADSVMRPRSNTLPLKSVCSMITEEPNDSVPHLHLRRPTIKNLATATLRVQSSKLSHTIVRNKLTPHLRFESNAGAVDEEENIIKEYNLLLLKRYPCLKRRSSNPLDLLTNYFVFSNTTNSESPRNEEEEEISDIRPSEEISFDQDSSPNTDIDLQTAPI